MFKTKVCIKCGKRKKRKFFCINKDIKDGRNYYCKECVNKSHRICKKEKEEKRRKKLRNIFKYGKICNICGKKKKINLFYRKRSHLDGHCSECKECHIKKGKELRKLRSPRRESIELLKNGYKYCLRCKKKKKINDFYFLKSKKWIQSRCKVCQNELAHFWQINNKDKVKIIQKRHYPKVKKRYKTDVNIKLRHQLGSRISKAIRGYSKSKSTMELLGCSIAFLKKYLEYNFKKGMTWANYGSQWSVDHIRPCVSFDLSKAEEQKKCFFYKNLQPLWRIENIKKGAKFEGIDFSKRNRKVS